MLRCDKRQSTAYDSSVVKGIMFIYRFACQLYTKFLENLDIHIREHDRCVGLAAIQPGKLGESQSGVLIRGSTCRKSNQHFVGVKTRIFAL